MPTTDPVERLPPEIFDEILGLVWGASLSCKTNPKWRNAVSPLATVSRKWKRLIERLTFRELDLWPRRVSEAMEGKYYTSEGLLNTQSVLIDLPHAFCTGEETDKLDRQVVESHINKIIHQIFELLSHLPRLETPHVELMIGSVEFCHEHCKAYGVEFLELDTNWENLPELPMVSSFKCSYYHGAWLSPRTHCRLASKMPRLNEAQWEMRDRIGKRRSVHVKDRSDFGRSLDLLPKSLTKFDLDIFSPSCNRSYHARERMHTNLPNDIFSQGVRRLIQRDGIIKVSLVASVDSNIFCPTHGSQEDVIHCPTLENLEVNFTGEFSYKTRRVKWDKIVSPISLHPRNTQGPDISSNNEKNGRRTRRAGKHKRRKKPDQETMDLFHVEVARSVSHMPKIVYLSCHSPGRVLGGFSFSKQSDDPYKGFLVHADPAKFRLSQEALDSWKTTTEAHGIEFNLRIVDLTEPLYWNIYDV